MPLECLSPCKVNLLLNILGKRPDGFHELETILHPVSIFDRLEISTRAHPGIELTCNVPSLPVGPENLVFRAAEKFLSAARVKEGLIIQLQKEAPMAAGLGGGSANAAMTFRALNELFGQPLSREKLNQLAAELGSDIPFFLQDQPALALGRGEKITPLAPFAALKGVWFFLVYPGFGISTAWAYQQLARHPSALQGKPGRARALLDLLERESLADACGAFYNSLETPALRKFPILGLYQEFLREKGAAGALMSGSGSTTFALFAAEDSARAAAEEFQEQFGDACWIRVVPVV
jgi:4-diphosphocytidyl-2-C-methyl-D-erythritol kinase